MPKGKSTSFETRPHFVVAKRIGWHPRNLRLWLRRQGIKTKGITVEKIEGALRKVGRAELPAFKEVFPVPHAKALDNALRNLHDAEGHLQAYYQCLDLARDALAEG